MNVVQRHFLQLGTPHLDVLARLVEVLALLQGVEDEHAARADAGGEVPATIVAADVVVDECLLEVVGALEPILLEVLSQVAGDDHAAAVRHEPGRVHVTHQCVDEWHASPAFSPPLHDLRIRFPVVVGTIVDAVRAEALVALPHKPVFVVVAPEELVDEDACSIIGTLLLLVLLRSEVYLPAAERAVRKPRRQFRGILRAQ